MAQSYSQLNQYGDALPKSAPPEGPPTQMGAGTKRLYDMSESVCDIANRLENLSDRLFGSSPAQNAGATGPTPVPNGALQAMGDAMTVLSIQIDRVRQFASRLEDLA